MIGLFCIFDIKGGKGMDKPFKTFKEQVEILNGGNGGKLRVKTDDETIYYLMRYNYYSIINFYKEPFLKGKDLNGNDTLYKMDFPKDWHKSV